MPIRPTLSVVLTAHNEEASLPTQLNAILSQSRPCDQLVLQDDGSTDGTLAIMKDVVHNRLDSTLVVNKKPSGINSAFNKAVTHAKSGWLYLASANDELLPGAFEAWEKAVMARPNAKIACGNCEGHSISWMEKTGFLTPNTLRLCLTRDYIHGGAVFIHRHVWFRYSGYREDLGSLADFWLYHMVAGIHGCLYLPETIVRSSSRYRYRPSGHADVHDSAKRAEIVAKIDALLDGAFADVRFFFDAPALRRVLGKTVETHT